MARQKSNFHSTDPLRCKKAIRAKGHKERGNTPQYAMVYMEKGKVQYKNKDHDVIVAAGQAFQRLPCDPHQLHYLEDSVTAWIAVPGKVYELMREMGLASLDYPCLDIGKGWGFLRRHTQLAKELETTPATRDMVILTKLQDLLIECHLRAQHNFQTNQGLPWLSEAQRQLELQLTTPIPDIAKALKVGYSTFRKQFKENIGISPGDYRLEYRIRRAKMLLEEGIPVGDIAERLAYPDIYAFSAQFKKRTGHSPTSWAREH